MWIEMKCVSVWGEAGKVVEVSEGVGYSYIQDGSAVEAEAPKAKSKPARGTRAKISNKALSAAS